MFYMGTDDEETIQQEINEIRKQMTGGYKFGDHLDDSQWDDGPFFPSMNPMADRMNQNTREYLRKHDPVYRAKHKR